MPLIRQPNYDLNKRPFLVIWETTRACDLSCRHCRAESIPVHDPNALTTDEGRHLLTDIGQFGTPPPLVILTGGDPFKRADIFDLTAHGASLGLPIAVSPSGTPLLNSENLTHLKASGAKAISLSLDGSNAAIHDDFRRVPGSFEWTLNGWKIAQNLGLKIQINTTVTRYNLDDLPEMFALVRKLGAMTWSVFFLVPTGRGISEDEISGEDYEAVMNFLYDASKYIGIKTTEGHHYKRVVLQRVALELAGQPVEKYMQVNGTYHRLMEGLRAVTKGNPNPPADHIHRTPMHVSSGDGFVFISLYGEVFPSGYLPMSVGNVRQASINHIYQESPLFQALRDKTQLKGRCGQCEFNTVCGGSRSRAFAATGDVMAEEPYCTYQPGSFPFINEVQQLLERH
jgi:AdoMet-dependent heme synthase